jgi:thiamine biosynthesis lipoprotein
MTQTRRRQTILLVASAAFLLLMIASMEPVRRRLLGWLPNGLASLPTTGPAGQPLIVRATQPVAVMGTKTSLMAVVEKGQEDRLARGLEKAERALRRIEGWMSTYINLSELSRLNRAPAGQFVKLSPQTLEVLHLAKKLHRDTGSAFDATYLRIFKLWGRAGKAKRLPTDAELAAARRASGWDKFELLKGGARKTVAEAGIGLGGIAKGYAIDEAAEAMKQAGCAGGLVDVGGDIRCFGPSPRGGPWRVGVRNPFDPGGDDYLATLVLTGQAVCTSGNYERFAEIGGKRYSHIIDPRTGRPVSLAPSVTVVAPTAAVADGWATALSVLGRKGLGLIDPNSRIEALVVTGGPKDYQLHQTPGFAKLLARPMRPAPGAPAKP